MQNQSYTRSFASIYDNIMERVPYYFWYRYLKSLLSYYKKSPKNIIEFACGTGSMIRYFADDVDSLIGLDKSSDMLSIARDKLDKFSNVQLINTDMSSTKNYGQYDFIYSVFDSINYILEYKDLVSTFANAYNNLNNDGIFIFDINTLYRLMHLTEGTKKINGDNFICYWKDIVDQDANKWIVNLNIYINSNENRKDYSEKHIEKGYKFKSIKNALKKAGFKKIDIYRSFTFKKGNKTDDRVHFVALKEDYEKNIFKQSIIKISWFISKPFILNIFNSR